MAELDFITSLTRHKPLAHHPELQLAIGDDCAVVKKDDQFSLLYTMDSLISGVHFDLSFHPPYLLGRKAVAVNISDIAGMGGTPKFALLSICLPPSFTTQNQQEFMAGFFSMCDEFGVILIGGDTVSGECLSITVTLIGEVETDIVCTRGGADIGDDIWISGCLGSSSVGLCLLQTGHGDLFPELVKSHLDPAPQVKLGNYLAQVGGVTSMVDSSDGIATDLAHICTESSCGAVVYGGLLPVSAMMEEAAVLTGQEPLQQALVGGEDYGLLFTVKAGLSKGLAQRIKADLDLDVSLIGVTESGQGVRLSDGDTMTDISFKGYEHK